jgi:tetratricopeptide (TPR) repeat protein
VARAQDVLLDPQANVGVPANECLDKWCNWDYYTAAADPEHANTLHNEEIGHLKPGIQRMRERLFGSALTEFTHVLVVFPNHPIALDRLSMLCELWKDWKCAGRLNDRFARAIAINPNAAGTYEVIGIAQARLKQPKLAIESCKKALELNPNSVNAHYTLGLMYLELKQYAAANEHAQKAYELGAPLPGLREKLRRVGQWKPSAGSAPAEPARSTEPAEPVSTK